MIVIKIGNHQAIDPQARGMTGCVCRVEPASFPFNNNLSLCKILKLKTFNLKGNMHTISPGRNRVNFQILAYLLTIDLLYGTGCLSYWFC